MGQRSAIDDIDIVIPDRYLDEKFLYKLIEIMDGIGYHHDSRYRNEFTKGRQYVGFEAEKELKYFANVDVEYAKTTEINTIKFNELRLVDYLAVYEKALERLKRKVQSHELKIHMLRALVERV